MKTISTPIYTLFLTLIILTGCSKNLSYTEALSKNEEEFNSTQMIADANFLVEAASYYELQIELCKMAVDRSYAVVTKEMATQHLQDHKKMREDLREVADNLDAHLPIAMSSEHRASYLKVKASNRRNFDQEFTDVLKETNENMERKFTDMATKGYAAQTRAFAARKLEVIRRHLISIDEVRDSLLQLE